MMLIGRRKIWLVATVFFVSLLCGFLWLFIFRKLAPFSTPPVLMPYSMAVISMLVFLILRSGVMPKFLCFVLVSPLLANMQYIKSFAADHGLLEVFLTYIHQVMLFFVAGVWIPPLAGIIVANTIARRWR